MSTFLWPSPVHGSSVVRGFEGQKIQSQNSVLERYYCIIFASFPSVTDHPSCCKSSIISSKFISWVPSQILIPFNDSVWCILTAEDRADHELVICCSWCIYRTSHWTVKISKYCSSVCAVRISWFVNNWICSSKLNPIYTLEDIEIIITQLQVKQMSLSKTCPCFHTFL